MNTVLARMMNVENADPYNRADVNKDGIVDINDVNYIIDYLLNN